MNRRIVETRIGYSLLNELIKGRCVPATTNLPDDVEVERVFETPGSGVGVFTIWISSVTFAEVAQGAIPPPFDVISTRLADGPDPSVTGPVFVEMDAV
jgi:hypothetical protein